MGQPERRNGLYTIHPQGEYRLIKSSRLGFGGAPGPAETLGYIASIPTTDGRFLIIGVVGPKPVEDKPLFPASDDTTRRVVSHAFSDKQHPFKEEVHVSNVVTSAKNRMELKETNDALDED